MFKVPHLLVCSLANGIIPLPFSLLRDQSHVPLTSPNSMLWVLSRSEQLLQSLLTSPSRWEKQDCIPFGQEKHQPHPEGKTLCFKN